MAYENVQNAIMREQEKRREIQRQMSQPSGYNPNAQVSGRSIPYSPIQGLTQIGKALIQKNAMEASDKRTEGLQQEAIGLRENAFDRVMRQMQGAEERPAESFQGQAPVGPPVPAIEADPVRAALMAQSSGDPAIQGMGKMIMPDKGRGGYTSVIDYFDPETQQTRKVVHDHRAPAGQNLFELDGKPIKGGGLSTASPEAKAAVVKAQEVAKVTGEDEAKAMVDLPMAEVKASETLTLVDELLDHPGFKDAVGFWDNPLALGGMMPATEAAGFKARLKQLEGRTFMEIFPTLKGGGQITEIEGEKGQLSINRMAQATNEKEFIQAANDFKSEVERLRGVVRTKAGKAQTTTGSTGADKRQQLLDKY